VPPWGLPRGLGALSPYTPTRQLGNLAWAAVLGGPLPLDAAFQLVGYTVLFAAAAAWAYRRNVGQRYR
jgi:ABC-2 type transport system permease protein